MTDEGVLPEFGGELDHFVSAKCAAWMYRMRRSSTFGKGARWVCALSLAGRAGCGAGSGIQTCAHGGKIPVSAIPCPKELILHGILSI